MRKATVVLTSAAALVALAAAAAPAHAVDGTTTVALTIADGSLAIVTTAAAPAASSAISGTGRTVTAPLGLTTITDTRAASTGWTLTATTTAFTPVNATTLVALPGGTPIPASAAKFSLSEAPTKVLGTATFTHTASPSASGSLAVATATGINTATVLPVLTVQVPADAANGLYTGTVTQCVV